MSLAATTNQREHDKFALNDAGETAIRSIIDSHDVTVDNLPSEYPLLEDQITTLTPPTTIKITDGSNIVALHESADGDYHLGVSIEQNVIADPNNSSTTNLAAGETWTGTAVSTLGVVGLQWNLYATENCTLYSEESPDGTNWDISYSFNYIASKGGQGETVQATNAYWRLRVKNEGSSATTTFRVSGVLCPIATPLPSSLSGDSRLKSESTLCGKENIERHVWVSPTNSLTTDTQVRLVGTNFDGTTKDTNFWTETVTNDGTVVQNGEIKLQTNTTANGTAKYGSSRKARFVVGSSHLFQGIYKFNDTVTEADNVRRCGAYDTNNGYFFELDSGVFSVGTRSTDGTPTLVSSGDFNGNMGSTFTPLATVYYKLTIEYSPNGAFYYVNGQLLHKSIGGHLTRFLTLPITMENINDNDNATAVIFDCLGVVISRQGQLDTAPTSYYFASGTTAGVQLKIGAGNIHSIVFGSAANNAVVTLVDNTTGSTPVLWQYQATGALDVPIDVNMTGLPFYTGLRIIVATGNASFTIIYE